MKDYRAAVENAAIAVKIELHPEEAEQFTKELAAFEKWLEPLLAVDTAQTRPLFYSHQAANIFREDNPESGELAQLQKTSANFRSGFYLVPAIIE